MLSDLPCAEAKNPKSSFKPLSVGKQYGWRTDSTRRVGSQKLTLSPMLKLPPFVAQVHKAEPRSWLLSSWPMVSKLALPIFKGKMQDQQKSVMGFGNLPVQVAAPAARLRPGS